MRKSTRHTLLLSGAGVLVLGLGLPAVADGGGAQTLTVGNTTACAGADYATIGAAVAAASPGDTIQVCAGIYDESVQVTMPLTFVGAQAGKDARKGRTNQKKESVVADAAGDFVIASGVSGVSISGFTLTGAGTENENADAIEAFQGGSGFTFTDNIISNNDAGINMQNPDGSQPSLVSDNKFVNNSGSDQNEGGTGVFISNGPADSTTIEDNSFSGDASAAVNFAGDSGNPSTGLVVTANSSLNDATFVVATNSTNALISSNKITVNAATNGSAILDYGSNQSLHISKNNIKGGAESGTSGIRISNYSGTASTGTSVTGNTISGRYNGIRVTGGYSDLFVSGNKVSGSANVGIFDNDSADGGNVYSQNKVVDSGVYSCEDDTTGSLTAGTANTWQKDSGKGQVSTPVGICTGP